MTVENACPDVSTSTAPIASAIMASPEDSTEVNRRLTRSQSYIFQLPETPSVSRIAGNGKIERRITLLRDGSSTLQSDSNNYMTSMDSGCSIVLPLDDGKTLLEMDPTQKLDLSLLKREIGSQAREQVVRQVQELQSQLSALLAGMDED